MNLKLYFKSGNMVLSDIIEWSMSKIKEGRNEKILPVGRIYLYLSAIPIIELAIEEKINQYIRENNGIQEKEQFINTIKTKYDDYKYTCNKELEIIINELTRLDIDCERFHDSKKMIFLPNYYLKVYDVVQIIMETKPGLLVLNDITKYIDNLFRFICNLKKYFEEKDIEDAWLMDELSLIK